MISNQNQDDIDCDPLGEVFKDIYGNKFYTSLKIKGLYVALGSFVKVILESDDDLDSYGYCQILAIYDKVVKESVNGITMEESDQGIVYIEVRWFLEPHEIGRVKKMGIELFENELVETEHLDDIPAGSICDIINIIQYKSTNTSNNANNKTFICRYSETRETNAILKTNIRSIFERGMALSEYNHAYISHLETCTDIDASTSDIYSRAIRQLHISILPETLPCRNEEQMKIELHIRKGIGGGGATKPIYISGMPGTGKTATVLATISALKKEASENKFPRFDFVEINCLRLATPADAYTALWRNINGEHVSNIKALTKLTEYFEGTRSKAIEKRTNIICLVDEIDFLITRDDNIVYNFFNWPTLRNSRLVVIGIANIMDLPERLSTRVASRLQASMERMIFGTYSYEQVESILKNRLLELNLPSEIFEEKTLELLARKASSVAGDLRAALKICQRSIELFRDQSSTRKIDKIDNIIVNVATNEYKGSPMMATISNGCALDKAVILTMCKNYNVNGETETIISDLWDRLLDFFRLSFKDPLVKLHQPPYFIFEESLERIINQGLVKKSFARGHSGSKITKLTLRMEITDVRAALKDDPLFKYGGF